MQLPGAKSAGRLTSYYSASRVPKFCRHSNASASKTIWDFPAGLRGSRYFSFNQQLGVIARRPRRRTRNFGSGRASIILKTATIPPQLFRSNTVRCGTGTRLSVRGCDDRSLILRLVCQAWFPNAADQIQQLKRTKIAAVRIADAAMNAAAFDLRQSPATHVALVRLETKNNSTKSDLLKWHGACQFTRDLRRYEIDYSEKF